jgi:hypothetical protein
MIGKSPMNKSNIPTLVGIFIFAFSMVPHAMAAPAVVNGGINLIRAVNVVDSKVPNIGSNLPNASSGILKGIVDPSKLSTNDITGILRSVGVLAISLILIIFDTVGQILKALLPFLK